MLGEVEISEAPQNAHHTFSQDIGSSIQHQTSTFMASFTAHFFDFRFVKLELRREHKWNPNELQHLSWPYDQHHPCNQHQQPFLDTTNAISMLLSHHVCISAV